MEHIHLIATAVNGTGADGSGIFAVGGCFLLVIILLSLAALGLIIWAIIDLVGNPALSGPVKIIWALVIFFIPLIGSILYLVIGRNMTTDGTPGGTPGGTV
jgi:hypothetical protein